MEASHQAISKMEWPKHFVASTGTMHDNNEKFVDLNSRKARNFSIAPAGTVDEYSRDARDITPVELFDKFTQGEDDQDFIAVDDGNDDNIE